MKSFPASLCPPLPLYLALYAGLDWPFGNCFSCLGCLAVAPICSDYMHTEWTCYGTGWLYLTNSLWHCPPGNHFLFRACCSFTATLLEPTENLIHLVSRTDVQLAICLGSISGHLDSWANTYPTPPGYLFVLWAVGDIWRTYRTHFKMPAQSEACCSHKRHPIK